ncbi:MAG: hypothetical protein V3R73_05755 [Sphingomonadales bacterium]
MTKYELSNVALHPAMLKRGQSYEALDLDSIVKRVSQLVAAQREQQIPSKFTFEWKEIAFSVFAERNDDGTAQVHIEAEIGRMPYSVENRFARTQAISLALDHGCSGIGRFKIRRDGIVTFTTRTATEKLSSFPEILNSVTVQLLRTRDQLLEMRALLLSA